MGIVDICHKLKFSFLDKKRKAHELNLRALNEEHTSGRVEKSLDKVPRDTCLILLMLSKK